VQEIEGKKHDPLRRRVDGRTEGVKIGDAVLVLDDHLAIDQDRFAGQLAASLDRPPIGPRPVIAIPGEGADLASRESSLAQSVDQVRVIGISGLMKPKVEFEVELSRSAHLLTGVR
jgi:hypothetical protein